MGGSWLLWASLGGCAPDPPRPEAHQLQANQRRPLRQARGQCTIDPGGGPHDAVVLLDGVRWHVAVLGQLRMPVVVLRSDGLGVALTAGRDHRVADAAAEVLRAAAMPSLGDVAGLLAGRVPDRPVVGLDKVLDGRTAVVQSGGEGTRWVTLLDDAAALEVLSVSSRHGVDLLGVRRSPGALPDVLTVSGPGVFVELRCRWEALGDVPSSAFSLAPPPGVVAGRLEDLGWGVLAELTQSGRLPASRREP